MKINAKGMFKRLGYKREIILNYRFISYRKPRGTSFCYIQFDLKEKTYEAHYFDPKRMSPKNFKPQRVSSNI